jgi:hypothetical protein
MIEAEKQHNENRQFSQDFVFLCFGERQLIEIVLKSAEALTHFRCIYIEFYVVC